MAICVYPAFLPAVHGFSATQLSVEEGNTVNVPFQLNAKGSTQFGAGLAVSGRVRAAADGYGSEDTCYMLPYHKQYDFFSTYSYIH